MTIFGYTLITKSKLKEKVHDAYEQGRLDARGDQFKHVVFNPQFKTLDLAVLEFADANTEWALEKVIPITMHTWCLVFVKYNNDL